MGVEKRHGETDLVATTACYGTAVFEGELDGDRGGYGSGWSRVCFLVPKGEGKRE